MTLNEDIEFDGVEYRNQKELAEAYGVGVGAFNYRLREGRSIRSALGLIECVLVDYYGTWFSNFKEIDEYFDLTVRATNQYHRRNQPISVSDSIDIVRATKILSGRTILMAGYVEIEGKRYPNLKSACEDYGVRYKSARSGTYTVMFPDLSKRIRHLAGLGYRGKLRGLLQEKRLVDVQRRKLEHEREVELTKLVSGEYTAVAKCRHCDEFYAKDAWHRVESLSGMGYGYCSDQCKNDRERELRRENRPRTKHLTRARKYNTEYETGITAKKLADMYSYECQVCGDEVEPHLGQGHQPKGWSVGHIVAMSQGGDHTWDNVQLECMGCNISKGVYTNVDEATRARERSI